MAVSIVLSGITALTLTPALCVMLLKNNHHANQKKQNTLERFFAAFNRGYDKLAGKYKHLISVIANRRTITFGGLILFLTLTGILGKIVPNGFIPEEDQGAIYASITTPNGSTLERTEKVVDQVQYIANNMPDVENVSSLAGFSVLSDGTGAVYGMNLISLKPWDSRKNNDKQIIDSLIEKTKNIQDAEIEFFGPPPVPGYGNSSGFELRLLDRSGSGSLQKMQEVADKFVIELNKRPEISNAFSTFNNNFPQYLLKIDIDKAAQMGVTADNAMSSLQTLIGSEYATNFIRFGQMYRVMVQSLPVYRAQPDDLLKLYVKNDKGTLVPYSSFLSIEKVYGPEMVSRYNMYTSAMINGQPASGYTSGEAINAIKEVAAASLPKGFGYDWAGSSRDQANSGNQAIFIFLLCLAFVYLLLSAQYESFLLPLSVILSLPSGIFGAFAFLSLLGLENNIYAQVAMIMLIGILGKNAILIVEFAIMRHSQGSSVFEAAIEGAVLRLRPILMTSLAFIAGLIPLMLASGAGKIGNNTIGSAAAGGMLFGTFFGLILTPGLYVLFGKLEEKIKSREPKPLTEKI
jgi:HAE1 family hydrophobic/amphiphilic exporter-1